MLAASTVPRPADMPFDAPDFAPDAIAAPRARALFDWWIAARGDRPMPARGDFLSEDLAIWWPDLILYEIDAGPRGARRYRFRVHGSNAAQADGVNYTGHYLDEIMPEAYRKVTLDCYDAMADRRVPLYSRGHRIMRSGVRMSFERLLLPLGSGEATHVLALLLWRLPTMAGEIDALAIENVPFVIDVIGFVVS